MNNYKFKIDSNGFYSGYGSDGTIPMTKKYNDKTPPSYAHRSVGNKWVLDEVKYKEIKTVGLTEKIESSKKELILLESQLKNL